MKTFLKALVVINGVGFFTALSHVHSLPDSTGPIWAYLYVMGCFLDGMAGMWMWHAVGKGLKE